MMANLINYGSEFSEPASEMRGCFEKMILAGTKTVSFMFHKVDIGLLC